MQDYARYNVEFIFYYLFIIFLNCSEIRLKWSPKRSYILIPSNGYLFTLGKHL